MKLGLIGAGRIGKLHGEIVTSNISGADIYHMQTERRSSGFGFQFLFERIIFPSILYWVSAMLFGKFEKLFNFFC
jgi:hypothetical protein